MFLCMYIYVCVCVRERERERERERSYSHCHFAATKMSDLFSANVRLSTFGNDSIMTIKPSSTSTKKDDLLKGYMYTVIAAMTRILDAIWLMNGLIIYHVKCITFLKFRISFH